MTFRVLSSEKYNLKRKITEISKDLTSLTGLKIVCSLLIIILSS